MARRGNGIPGCWNSVGKHNRDKRVKGVFKAFFMVLGGCTVNGRHVAGCGQSDFLNIE